ncbi:MAG: BamA/TamA family outer membrane protein, partial [Gemmatimonadetes bacterium]|nr:BamA/TamA family outer membrane protein [Gemmatimonadota bacterium]NIU29918.1 BamA/TamA family outer membrane protein [Gemmatimonadota bacterium]NIV60325.1 BamA/TamA family outer membrane protein [Gemmatimonadota bacterium]NIW62988.1 BamA/TamA family outer membrane protein [Gemmatimonadota bacterium]NIX38367.1 BamA/TamA family outer membrane protein [Gemmatimonadota bacterium]
EDEGNTLYALQHGASEETTWLSYARAGLVWDTRDRETGPTSGAWTELLVRVTDPNLGADVSFTRWTFTDRRYFALTDDLV